jgi:hypothetical protein
MCPVLPPIMCRKGRDSNRGLCRLPLQAVCQPTLRRTAQECPVRTSLDLELDLQASLTRQSRLNDELQALRGLRQKLEELKAQGETDLPPGVLEDERFQKLLKQAEKQVQGCRSPTHWVGLVQLRPWGWVAPWMRFPTWASSRPFTPYHCSVCCGSGCAPATNSSTLSPGSAAVSGRKGALRTSCVSASSALCLHFSTLPQEL